MKAVEIVPGRSLRWGLGVAFALIVICGLILGAAYNAYETSRSRNLPSVDIAMQALRTRPSRGVDSYPRLWFPPSSPVERLNSADSILRGSVDLNGRFMPLPPDPSWSDGRGTRNQALLLHAMQWIDDLMFAYRNTGNIAYLARAEQLVLSWIERNSGYVLRPPSEFSWNDHSTAIRATVLVRFWEIWRLSPLADDRKARLIVSSLLGHGDRLSDAAFYTPRHNHGIDQDIALLSIAAVFPEHRASSSWTELALGRVKAQIEYVVSPTGVQREHSPDYQVVTLSHLYELDRVARLAGRAIQAHDMALIALVQKMASVASLFVMPDGTLAPVGDTVRKHAVSDDHEVIRAVSVSDPAAQFVYSSGQKGVAPRELTSLLDDGYAVVRRQASPFSNGLYLLLIGASNKGLGHKHRDELSFVLYACGRTMLDDAGHVSYQSDDQRAFTVGPYAHNSLVVGDVKPVPWLNGTGQTRLTRGSRHEGFIELAGASDENPQYGQSRTLLLIDRGPLIVIDQIGDKRKNSKAQKFTQVFNVGAGAEPFVRIEPLAPADVRKSVIVGQLDPMIGWRATKFGAPLEPATAITLETTATTIATMIEFPIDCGATPRRSEISAHTEAARLTLTWRDASGGTKRFQLPH